MASNSSGLRSSGIAAAALGLGLGALAALGLPTGTLGGTPLALPSKPV